MYAAVYFINAASLGNRMNGLEISDMLNYKKLDKSIDHPGLYQNIGFALLAFGLLLFNVFFTLVYQNIYPFYIEVRWEFILHQPVTDKL